MSNKVISRIEKYINNLLQDKGKCKEFLVKLGINTKTGKLTKRYKD